MAPLGHHRYVTELVHADHEIFIFLKTNGVCYLNVMSMFTTQKMKFSSKEFFSKCADLVIFTEEILHGKFHFLCICWTLFC